MNTPRHAGQAQGELGRFAIEEAIRALDRQHTSVERLRARALAFVGLTATSSAFFVGAAFESDVRGPRFLVPLAFGTVLFGVVFIQLWLTQRPIEDWRDRVSAAVIVDDFGADAMPDPFVKLAAFYDNAVVSNAHKLRLLSREVRILSATCGALTACWLILVWLVAA
jgi:hypothetical protein